MYKVSRDREIDPSQLYGQFRLAPVATLPDHLDWPTQECRGWRLETHPALPVSRLCATEGGHIGWVLGFCITDRGELAPPEVVVDPRDIAREGGGPMLGGRYIVVLLTPEIQRLYPDGAGSLAAVYADDAPIVSSTLAFISGPAYPWDDELGSQLNIAETGLWYPAGLTARRGVRRLLPNHFLDLANWSLHRFWPNGPRTPSSDSSATVAAIIRRVRFIFEAVASRFPLQLSLTAGRDSRILLACARPLLDKTTFFTATDGTGVEGHLPRRLAKRFNLKHRHLALRQSDPTQRAAWDAITGWSIGGDIAEIYTTFGALDPGKALLPGVAGEVGRANYGARVLDWRAPVSTAELLDVLRMPQAPRLVAALQAWRDEIGGCDNATLFDLLYIEQRVGAWAGPQHYGCDRYVACHITPFVDPQVLRLMLDLPWDFRYQEKFADEVCRQAWPELLEFPFNKLVGLPRQIARMRSKLKRVAQWGSSAHP